MEIAVIGKNNFCLGFRLTGIKKVFETESLMDTVSRVKADDSVGVVIVDQDLLGGLDEFQKKTLEDSSKPIFIALSTEQSDADLKRMIKKSIGVEL